MVHFGGLLEVFCQIEFQIEENGKLTYRNRLFFIPCNFILMITQKAGFVEKWNLYGVKKSVV